MHGPDEDEDEEIPERSSQDIEDERLGRLGDWLRDLEFDQAQDR